MSIANIIIIDDEQGIRETLAPMLEEAGFAAQCCENGAMAIEMAKKTFFDVIIVDYRLPDMDGLQLIKQVLLASPESVPIIISASSSIEIAVAAMRMGAHDYLVKPINTPDLIAIISTILNERSAFVREKSNRERIIKQLGNVAQDMGIVTIVQNKMAFSANTNNDSFTKLFGRIKHYFNPV
jgi:DNA-binding NtrC family response regulator